MFKCFKQFGVGFVLLTSMALCMAQGETLRDPTQPLGYAVQAQLAPQKTLRLQSVLVSGSRKLAYINGQQVREQDLLNDSHGIKVVSIDAEGVILQQGEKRWRLALNKVAVRQ